MLGNACEMLGKHPQAFLLFHEPLCPTIFSDNQNAPFVTQFAQQCLDLISRMAGKHLLHFSQFCSRLSVHSDVLDQQFLVRLPVQPDQSRVNAPLSRDAIKLPRQHKLVAPDALIVELRGPAPSPIEKIKNEWVGRARRARRGGFGEIALLLTTMNFTSFGLRPHFGIVRHHGVQFSSPMLSRMTFARPFVFRVAMLALAVAATATRGAEALYLEYAVVSNVTPSKLPNGAKQTQGNRKPEESRYAMKVCLAESCFSIDGQKAQAVYDFKTRRIRYGDPKTASWSDVSLYSQIGFRVMEYQNRMFLGGALAAAGVAAPGMNDNEFAIQTIFGLKLPKNNQPPSNNSAPAVKKTTRGGFDIFNHNGEEYVRVKYSERAVPATLRPVFERFLAYQFNIHPDIRLEIAKSGKVPSEIILKWENIGENIRDEYKLTSAQLGGAPEKWPGADAPPTDLGDAEMKAAFAAARDSARFAQAKTARQTGEYIDARMAAGVAPDALLAIMEYGLQNGESRDQVIQWISKYKDKFQADSRCRLYFASTLSGPDSGNQERAKEALASLDKIDRQGLEKAYVLDIQRGDLLTFLQDWSGARAAFLAALKSNPFIAGVWKDLGDLYRDAYETDVAWACWDTARRLYPNHFMLEEINNFEGRLRKDFPEFFLP